jgi:hypothetical protein
MVIDYKTGRTDAGHYALQMGLYLRAASSRYVGEQIDTAISRLSPDGALFSLGTPLPAGDLERAILEVGSFESDVVPVYGAFGASPNNGTRDIGLSRGMPGWPRRGDTRALLAAVIARRRDER